MAVTDWIIINRDGHEDREDLWWNNDTGWGSRETATRFTEEESQRFNLPLGGQWVAPAADLAETCVGWLQVIELPQGIRLAVGATGVTAISCSQMESCRHCQGLFCPGTCRDALVIGTGMQAERELLEGQARVEFNVRIDGMLSLLQNMHRHGFAGLFEEAKPQLAAAIDATMEYIVNQE